MKPETEKAIQEIGKLAEIIKYIVLAALVFVAAICCLFFLYWIADIFQCEVLNDPICNTPAMAAPESPLKVEIVNASIPISQYYGCLINPECEGMEWESLLVNKEHCCYNADKVGLPVEVKP